MLKIGQLEISKIDLTCGCVVAGAWLLALMAHCGMLE